MSKLLKANKSLAKETRGHLREIAQLLAFKHHNTVPFDPVAVVHREEGEPDFMNVLTNELMTKVEDFGMQLFVGSKDTYCQPCMVHCCCTSISMPD